MEKVSLASRAHWAPARRPVSAARCCRFLALSSGIPEIVEARRASFPIDTPHIKHKGGDRKGRCRRDAGFA